MLPGPLDPVELVLASVVLVILGGSRTVPVGQAAQTLYMSYKLDIHVQQLHYAYLTCICYVICIKPIYMLHRAIICGIDSIYKVPRGHCHRWRLYSPDGSRFLCLERFTKLLCWLPQRVRDLRCEYYFDNGLVLSQHRVLLIGRPFATILCGIQSNLPTHSDPTSIPHSNTTRSPCLLST